MGLPRPFLTSSTPAMKVLETAPMPGSRIPSLPLAGGIRLSCLFIFVDSPEIQHDSKIEEPADRGGPQELVDAVHHGEEDEEVDEVALGERVLQLRELGLSVGDAGLGRGHGGLGAAPP